MEHFNNQFGERCKNLAIHICRFLKKMPYDISTKEINRQMVRSGTSIAANFRAAGRARSVREYHAKICIVVEECDETLFWIELLESITGDNIPDLSAIKNETVELLKVFSTTKRKIREKLTASKNQQQ